MKPVKVVTCDVVDLSGRRCLNFVGTMKHRHSSREELLTGPELLSDWAVQAGLLDAATDVTDDDLTASLELREAIYRTVTARLEGRRPQGRRRRTAQRAGLPTSAHAAITAHRRNPPRRHHVATAGEPGRGSARPSRRSRHRERQAVCAPGLHPPVSGCVTSQEPALVRDGHLRQQGESPGLPGPPAGVLRVVTRREQTRHRQG